MNQAERKILYKEPLNPNQTSTTFLSPIRPRQPLPKHTSLDFAPSREKLFVMGYNTLMCHLKATLQTRSHLLQLPVELVLDILDFLPPHAQLLVNQTCRALRTITHQHLLAGREHEILDSRFHKALYLSDLSHSLPDKWACSECLKLHSIPGRETPQSLLDYHPIGTRDEILRLGLVKTFGFCQCSPKEKQAQLMIKRTRVDDKKWRPLEFHFSRPIAPHDDGRRSETRSDKYPCNKDYPPSHVENSRDDKYLLSFVKAFLKAHIKASQGAMRYVYVYPYLYSLELEWTEQGRKKIMDMAFDKLFSKARDTTMDFVGDGTMCWECYCLSTGRSNVRSGLG